MLGALSFNHSDVNGVIIPRQAISKLRNLSTDEQVLMPSQQENIDLVLSHLFAYHCEHISAAQGSMPANAFWIFRVLTSPHVNVSLRLPLWQCLSSSQGRILWMLSDMEFLFHRDNSAGFPLCLFYAVASQDLKSS